MITADKLNQSFMITPGNKNSLEKRVNKLYNVGWIIGIVAAIFGISGAWGLKLINAGNEKIKNLEGNISKLDSNINKLQEEFNKSETTFRLIRNKNENDFNEFIKRKEDSFSSSVITKIKGSQLILPIGSIIPFGGKVEKIPLGWILCDGRSIKRSEYHNLFEKIGTNWGSRNQYEFNLPDLQGVFLRGVDYKSGRDKDKNSRVMIRPGGNAGINVGSFQFDATKLPNKAFETDEAGKHTHTFSAEITARRSNSGDMLNTFANYPAAARNYPMGEAGLHKHTITTGGDSETRPKNAYVNYIIKVN